MYDYSAFVAKKLLNGILIRLAGCPIFGHAGPADQTQAAASRSYQKDVPRQADPLQEDLAV